MRMRTSHTCVYGRKQPWRASVRARHGPGAAAASGAGGELGRKPEMFEVCLDCEKGAVRVSSLYLWEGVLMV